MRLRRLPLMTLATALLLITTGTTASADTADAIPIPSIPYTDTVDFSTASADTEAADCVGSYPYPSVWYAYTAVGDQALVASVETSVVAIFTGSPGSLTNIGCSYGSDLFEVAAGQTVYIAVVDYDLTGGSDTFTLEAAPPPFHIELTLDPTATIGSTPGTATVSGSVTCNNEGYAEIYGSLRQKQGLNVTSGSFYFYTDVACSGTPTAWTATVDAGNRVYLTKAATLTATASGCDQFTCDSSDTVTRTVKVRK